MAKTLHSAARYAAAVTNVLPRGGTHDLRRRLLGSEDRLVFVVGSPRSGTTFLAGAIGAVPGLRRPRRGDAAEGGDPARSSSCPSATPRSSCGACSSACGGSRSSAACAASSRRPRRRSSPARRCRRIRPRARCTSSATGATSSARCSSSGWLSAERGGGDDAGLAYGARARFWVEPDRRAEFEAASDATRAAWAWRTYVTAARRRRVAACSSCATSRSSASPTAPRRRSPTHLGVDPAVFAGSLDRAHDRSVGRFRSDLTAEQLADVEREAGPLLAELGYARLTAFSQELLRRCLARITNVRPASESRTTERWWKC